MFWVSTFFIGAAVLLTSTARQCGDKEEHYLTKYAFLDEGKKNDALDLQYGILGFQLFNKGWGTNETGDCDETSLSLMALDRCGCEDPNKNEIAKARMMMSRNFIGPQQYNIGGTKWTKKVMTWTVTKYPVRNIHLSNAEVDDAMRRGLQIWADKTNIQFRKVSGSNADIRISFEIRRHTSQPPYYDFDGKSGVLAHAFFPQSGIVHFDDEEDYVLNSDQGTELYIVAAHEFGHTLGISHSNEKNALMAPYYRYVPNLKLDIDDVYAIQTLYGRKSTVTETLPPRTRPTQRPVITTPRPTKNPGVNCDMIITASFKIGYTSYVFTRESGQTVIYKVDQYRGIDVKSRKLVNEMFVRDPNSDSGKRVYPYRVDAATYVPSLNKVYLFSGTRAYRYSESRTDRDKFIIDSDAKFPKWFDVAEFPERPRAAISLKYSNSNKYYMMIFSETMMWFWDFYAERVGAWAYPLKLLGNLMPSRIDSAFSFDDDTVYMVREDMVYEFDLKRMRVVSRDSIKEVVKEVLKGPCI